jgi:hypothetical protein
MTAIEVTLQDPSVWSIMAKISLRDFDQSYTTTAALGSTDEATFVE